MTVRRRRPAPQGGDETELDGGNLGALRRLAKAMPSDLRWQVDELLLLYALNGVSDAAATRAVVELYSPPRVTLELERMRRRVLGMTPSYFWD